MANPPITIGPFANVPAPGSAIRSDWPQQISTFVNTLPLGRVTHSVTSADASGYGAGQLPTGLTFVVPPTPTGRTYVVTWSIGIKVTTNSPENFVILNQLRAGSAGGTVVTSSLHPFPLNGSTAGYDLRTETMPLNLTPGETYVLTTGTDGVGRYWVKANSFIALYDVT